MPLTLYSLIRIFNFNYLYQDYVYLILLNSILKMEEYAVSNKVALPVIKRLPKYYRYVTVMKKNGVSTVSSSDLSSMMGTTASQVRQDLNCFGGFGQQGIGYNVELLYTELSKLLFSGTPLNTILIGTGKLGRAISNFLAQESPGFHLVAAFDKSADEIGKEIAGLKIQDVDDLEKYCQNTPPQVAVLCIPTKSVNELAPTLSSLGVKGFWNFTHYDLATDNPGIIAENVHLGDSLMTLGYRVRNSEN